MSSSIDDIEFKIARLDLREGDILVVKIAQPLMTTTRDRLRDYIAKSSGGHQVMVLDGVMDLAVLTQAEIAERVK